MWLLEYRLLPQDPDNVILAGGMRMEDGWLTEYGSTGQPLLVVVRDISSDTWQRVGVTNTLTVSEEHGGDYTAATMAMYHSFLETGEAAAETTALEDAIVGFMGDGWWYAGEQKTSDYKAGAFVTLQKDETDGSLVFYGVALYRSYVYSEESFTVAEDFLIPCIITLDAETLSCTDFWVPGDGGYYEMDIDETFPADIAEEAALHSYDYYDQLAALCDEQARSYGGIGSTDALLTVTSGSQTVAPYENLVWSRTSGENGWVYTDIDSVFDDLGAVLDQLPDVTLREDLDIGCADGVSRTGLTVVATESLTVLYRGLDLQYLTSLPEGSYYVSINVTKQGAYDTFYRDAEGFGYECVFRYTVDEHSYD
jgi:hypothetical protein